MIEFLQPVSKAVVAHRELLPKGSLGKKIDLHIDSGELPELVGAGFAILGIRENRNHVDYLGEQPVFDELRKALYSLYPGNWNHRIVDLGDILAGETVKDTYFAVQTVLASLISKQVIPILLGGSQDLTFAQYRAYDGIAHMVNMVNVDYRFDLGDAELPIANTSYVGKVIVEEPYNLFNYSVVGYQSFLNPPGEIALMEKLFFDAYRLGTVTSNITSVEPVFRDADLVSFDVGAIQAADLGFAERSNPNGFNAREICAMARYAGISNRVSSFGLYEIPRVDQPGPGINLLAQVIWYFVEGVNFRVADEDFDDDSSYTTYRVPVHDEVLIFKKSNRSERWWIELPFISTVNNKLKRRTLLPCTYEEYLGATNQEIPDRWFKARRKNEV